MPVRLIESLATTAPLSDLFSDGSVLHAMLAFEAALARVEGRQGVIPRSAAQTISAVALSTRLDATAIAAETLQSGTPAIPFVRVLTERVRAKNKAAAGFVHWGATSQDVCDNALVLLLQKAQLIFEADLKRLEQALQRLSARHKHTVMLGRTWLQAAPPVTFGLKAAGWFGSIHRGNQRLSAAFEECRILQFGGATGTLASLGNNGPHVAQALANELNLKNPEAPWHTHRDRLSTLVCACGVLAGSLGKMARDITLLSQNEIAEVAEPSAPGRGGSSTMPHKQNPAGSVVAQAAALRIPGLVSSFLTAMVQEHERATGGWQAEWPIIAAVVQNTGLALACMAEVAEGLTVNEARMKANIAARQGAIFAERASLLLGKKLGRDTAHKLVQQASRKAATESRNLRNVLAEMPEVTGNLNATTLRDLEKPEAYLGAAEEFRSALLSSGRSGKASKNRKKTASLNKKR